MTDLFKPTYIRVGIPHNTVRPPTIIRPPTEGGQPTLGEVVEYTSQGNLTPPWTLPSIRSVGDILYVAIRGATTASVDVRITVVPAGYTELGIYDPDAGGTRAGIWWRRVDGTETDSTYTLSTSGAPVAYAAWVAKRPSGALPDPVISSFGGFVGGGAEHDPPSVSVPSAGDYWVFPVLAANKGGLVSLSTNYEQLAYQTEGTPLGTRLLVQKQFLALTTAEDPDEIGWSDSSGGRNYVNWTIAQGSPGAAVAAGDHAHDHGDLTGLADDDHTQYLNVARHDADDHSGLTVAQPLAFAKTGTLEVTTGVSKFPALFDMTLIGVRAAVGTAPTGADLIVDVNKNGTTVYTTQGNRPTISDGSTSSTETVPDVTAVAAGDLLSVDIDQIGSSTEGSDLVVAIEFQEA